jgi:hypothetical protein
MAEAGLLFQHYFLNACGAGRRRVIEAQKNRNECFMLQPYLVPELPIILKGIDAMDRQKSSFSRVRRNLLARKRTKRMAKAKRRNRFMDDTDVMMLDAWRGAVAGADEN